MEENNLWKFNFHRFHTSIGSIGFDRAQNNLWKFNFNRAEMKNYKEAMKYLENYRWSSFPDYIGKKNFPSVTQREFLNEFFEGPEQYKNDTLKWLKEMDLEEIEEIILE